MQIDTKEIREWILKKDDHHQMDRVSAKKQLKKRNLDNVDLITLSVGQSAQKDLLIELSKWLNEKEGV